jgi:hypothetical protein
MFELSTRSTGNDQGMGYCPGLPLITLANPDLKTPRDLVRSSLLQHMQYKDHHVLLGDTAKPGCRAVGSNWRWTK